MKKLTIALMLASVLTPVLSHAEAGDWVVRGRVAYISPNEDSKLGTTVNGVLGAGTMTPGSELKVDSNTIPEFDISYYWTKNIATELILAVGTRHDVKVTGDAVGTIGNQALGSVNLLPPTLIAQWHFNPDQMFDPYVGAGVNYTLAMDNKLQFASGAGAGKPIRISRDSFGPALQAGIDVNLKDGWLLNADIKYVWLDTKVETNLGAGWKKIDSLDINPWVLGFGVGKRF